MPFGATVAGDVFQHKLDECFSKIKQVIIIADHKMFVGYKPDHSIIQIGRIQTYSQLEISNFIFPFHKNKTVDARCSLVNRLQNPACNILSISCLEGSLRCIGTS